MIFYDFFNDYFMFFNDFLVLWFLDDCLNFDMILFF